MNMFQPKGDKPYWEMIYNHLVDLSVGDIITFDDIEDLTGAPLNNSRSAVLKARKELLKDTGKYLKAVRGEGYKVVSGLNIMDISKNRHRSANRQVKAADFETAHINPVELDPEERQKLQNFMMHNASIRMAFKANHQAIEAGVRANRERLVGLEAGVASAQVAQLFTEEQVNKLKELIGE